MKHEKARNNTIEARHSVFEPLLVTVLAGIVSAGLGMIVFIGWHTHNITLIQVNQTFTAMQYNTALGFLVGGAGLLAIVFNWRSAGLICGILIGILGLATTSQYIIPGLNLGIDQLFMKDYLTAPVPSPGRMSPITAICFLLSGIAIAIMAIPRWGKWQTMLVTLIGFLLSITGLGVYLGYQTEKTDLYVWQMSVQTATGFVSFGIGILAYIMCFSSTSIIREIKLLPIRLLIAASVALIIFAFDVFTPLSVSIDPLYVVVILLALFISEQVTLMLAILCSILIVAGMFLSPASNIPQWQIIINHCLAILVVWLTTSYGIRYRRTAQSLDISEQTAAGILDTVLDSVITINEEGIIQSINPATEKIFGYERNELVGNNINILMPSPYREEHDNYIDNYLRTGEQKIIGIGRNVEAVKKNGTLFPINLQIVEVGVGGQKLFTGIIRDITEQKIYEDQLRAAKKSAEEANRIKSAFLAMMSHELRTPLNTIIGYSEMIEEDATSMNEEVPDYIEDVRYIKSAGKHLMHLINDVLDISKIEAGKIRLSPKQTNLNELVSTVATAVRPMISKNGNTLKVGYPEMKLNALVDPVRLQQCLLNLLSNASKFTENGEITLELKQQSGPEKEGFSITVSDTGLGMKPEQLQQAFESFTQIDMSLSRKQEGTGLGLPISRKLIQLMGGDITVQSNAGVGSTFTIWLPWEMSAEHSNRDIREKETTDAVSQITPDSPLILLIDDDPQICKLITQRIEPEGYRVICAHDGESGLELIHKEKPAAVILDVLLPDKSGWSVLKDIKTNPEIENIPVIICSIVDDMNRGLELGASEYLIKPFDKERFLKILREYSPKNGVGTALIVEDDGNSRNLMARLLHRKGWRVIESINGREALHKLDQHEPDLILLDLMLPEMDGFEFLDNVRNERKWKDLHIVVISAKHLTEKEEQFLNGCVEQYIDKNLEDPEEILSKISQKIAKSVQSSL